MALKQTGAPRETPPRIAFQTSDRQAGKDCRYEHVNVSEANLEELKLRHQRATHAFHENGASTGEGNDNTGAGGVCAPKEAPQWEIVELCRVWTTLCKCDRRDMCPYLHPPE